MKIRYPLAIALLGSSCFSTSAFAQEKVATEPDKRDADADVIVTAQRREQNILDVPIAITAFTEQAITKTGATSLRDLVALTPGVSAFQTRPGSNIVQIRGVSSIVGDATVGYYLDDLPFTLVGQNFQPDINPYDIERVEILRGPQGTLYGAGSTGGTIRVITNDAKLNAFQVKGRARVSGIDGGDVGYAASGAVNVPIIKDKLAIRFVADYRNEGGYIDNSLTGARNVNSFEQQNYRVKLRFEPTDNFSIKLSYWRNEGRSNGENQSTANFDRPIAVPERNLTLFNLYNGAVEFGIGGLDVYSATSYIDYTNEVQDATLAGIGAPLRFDIPFRSTSFNHETRLSENNGGFLDWQLGAFYLDSRTRTRFVFQTNVPGVGLFPFNILSDRATSEQFAFFGQAYLNLAAGLRGTVGLRYYNDSRSREDFLPTSIAALNAFGLNANRNTTFDGWTPKFNLRYEFNPNNSVYVDVSRGLRSGLLQASTGITTLAAPRVVRQESVWTYEIGSKLQSADRRWTAEFAAYYSEWSNIQFTLSDFVNFGMGPTLINFVGNVDKASGFGVETAISARPIDGLTISANGAYTGLRYDVAIPRVTGAGSRVQLVPEWTGSGTIEYRRPINSSGMEAFIYSSANYSSQRPDYAFGIRSQGDDIFMIDLRAGLTAKNWSLTAFVQNLNNENGAIINSRLIPLQFRPQPRTVGLETSFKF